MNKEYLKAMTIAENALIQLKGLYDKASTEEFDNRKACKSLEKFIEDIEDFVRDIKHYSKDTELGYLQLNSNGRYVLNDTELTCGYPIEIYNTKYNEWNDGRIEHSSEYDGYYFYNYDKDHIVLNDCVKARIRV
ncbi:MAG: hypothetical protein F8N39_18145 [Clostridiaceae bacterium]|nr:hypothetical protein [Clostridiaceae bacterium]